MATFNFFFHLLVIKRTDFLGAFACMILITLYTISEGETYLRLFVTSLGRELFSPWNTGISAHESADWPLDGTRNPSLGLNQRISNSSNN